MSKVNSSTKSTRPSACTGIDLARRRVHAHGVDESAETCVDRKMTISQSRRHLGSLPPCTAAMESCGRAHCRGSRIRGLLAGFGIEIARGKSRTAPAVQQMPGDGGTSLATLHPVFPDTLNDLYQELQHKDQRIEESSRRIRMIATQDEQARLLMTIPGFGPIASTALAARVGDPGAFRNGREFAAWLGLVPRQNSAGGKDQLPGISKRGDICLRTRLAHGARAVLFQQSGNPKPDQQSPWIVGLPSRRHGNVTAAALASRMARIAWAVLATNQPCRTDEAMA